MFIEPFNKKLDIEEKVKDATLQNNLTKNETDTLKQLSQRDDILITNANKGGVAVIIDVGDYIREAQQLNNTDFCKKIPVNQKIQPISLRKYPQLTKCHKKAFY